MNKTKTIQKEKKPPLDPVEITILPIASILLDFSETIPPDLDKWRSNNFQRIFDHLDIERVRLWLDSGGFSDAARQFEESLNQFLTQLREWEYELLVKAHVGTTEQLCELQNKDEKLFYKLKSEFDDMCDNARQIAEWLKKLADMVNLKYPKDKTNKECSHSPNYRKIIWYGKPYTFSKKRAIAIQLLWEAHENPNKVGVHEREIGKALDTVNAKYRLIDTFRVKHNGKRGYDPAWQEIIEHTGSGVYQLIEPEK
jgi:hypothetical protein